ncbi:MAG: phosphoribosylanthranilate isomerase [Candidatus Verstraetearchaeota archaeon]|nr:phosphoribosylanthranilate isomerase [Candidatus Verstraetearchaeota archaeon]
MTVRVKICGLTSEKDLEAVCRLGADAVGFVVGVPESPRNLPLEAAKRLIRRVPVFVKSVLVTVPKNQESLLDLYEELMPDIIQIHGPVPWMSDLIEKIPDVILVRCVDIKSEKSVPEALKAAELFDAILADSPSSPEKHGGTGVTHDWNLSRHIRDAIYPKALILAGGLSVYNVSEATVTVKPYAVDVSTGVESKPGVKDPVKVDAFIKKAKQYICD